jgi:DNA polymerase-1
MRKFFVAKKGYVLVDADYSQIELRLLAAIAKDPVMISAFRSGFDIHSITAMQVFGVDSEGVTFELRKRAKAVNFGIVYGMGDYSLSQDLGVTKKEAARYIEGYKNTYKGVDEYLKKTVEKAYADGFVTTMLARRRYIPELASGKAMERAFGERVAMNSPIQGSAADIIKLAMINVEKALEESGLDARLILQVHDELIVECAETDAPKALEILKNEMEGAVSLAVPLIAEANIGRDWESCH